MDKSLRQTSLGLKPVHVIRVVRLQLLMSSFVVRVQLFYLSPSPSDLLNRKKVVITLRVMITGHYIDTFFYFWDPLLRKIVKVTR